MKGLLRDRARHAAVRFGRVAALVGLVCLACAARAADRIYWVDSAADKISFANLDGSGDGGDLDTIGATVRCPFGVAIDAAAGRIYWANCGGTNKISFANLDGRGGGDLDTTGATVNDPEGAAIDPAAGRIYWANRGGNAISFANLEGTGGGDLVTTGATVSTPAGVAIDPAAGRIYWGNISNNRISFAKLDGTGGGDLDTTGATVNEPQSVAVDPAAGRIYWASYAGNRISFAKLDGSGGGADLGTIGATVDGPLGVAIDAVAGRIYWGNYNVGKVSFAALNGTGGADLDTSGATVSEPGPIALLKVPSGAGSPAIAGGSDPESVLSCSPGSWAPDVLGAFLYRAPRSIAYQWSLNGAPIAGATASLYTAFVAGDYRCTVAASNTAGAASQTSEPHSIPVPTSGCVVPNLVGQTLAEASAAITKNGCRAGRVKRVRSRRVEEGRVVSQRPKAGKQRPSGAKVKLVVSRGRG